MPRYALTAIDVRGIQSYIFGSNNLQHNIGASELVHRVTYDWVYQHLPRPHNVSPGGELNDKAIERDNLTAEVVYIGGGNAVIMFPSHDRAVEFARVLSRRVLLEAPGLELFITHRTFAWDDESVSQVVRETLGRAIRQKKNDSRPSAPLLGLGVTADCQFTGLPATALDNENRRIAAEVYAKWRVFQEDEGQGRLAHLLDLQGYEVTKDFDQFGSRGESSYIAVVHTDGNSMGKRFQAIADRFKKPLENRSYVKAVRDLSQSVARASSAALKATVGRLIASVDPETRTVGGKVLISNKRLPFRPIVFGGDDVTFVCDGRLGLALAECYLREFARQSLADDKPASARAGIAVVKTHFPFARAYALAEELARSAKRRVKEFQGPPYVEENLSVMDWHFAVSGLVRSLDDIRERDYTVQWNGSEASLLMRPLRLGASPFDWRSWEVFSDIAEYFRGPGWVERRNKVKALREALRAGPATVRQFLREFETTLPEVPHRPTAKEDGAIGQCSAYYDAVEALDFFVPLRLLEEGK